MPAQSTTAMTPVMLLLRYTIIAFIVSLSIADPLTTLNHSSAHDYSRSLALSAGNVVGGGHNTFVLIERIGTAANDATDGERSLVSIASLKDLVADDSNGPAHSLDYGDFDYELRERVGRGHFGEIWTARRQKDDSNNVYADDNEIFVLKRLFVERGRRVRESGLREVHFGSRLNGADYVTEMVDSFEWNDELFIVFRHAGISLSQYLGGVTQSGQWTESAQWRQIKFSMIRQQDDTPAPALSLSAPPTPAVASAASLSSSTAVSLSANTESVTDNTTDAANVLRDLLFQLFSGVAATHRRGIVHRDIKPANILLKLHRDHPFHRDMVEVTGMFVHDDHDTINDQTTHSLGEVRVCDFGSALDVDEEANARLYQSEPPNVSQSTLEYAPPELVFDTSDNAEHMLAAMSAAYDSWSLGVLILYIVLGSRQRVFTVDERTRATIIHRLGGDRNRVDIERAILFRAFVDACVYELDDDEHTTNALSGAECTDDAFAERIAAVDPLKIGFGSNRLLLRLTRSLLKWSPSDRLRVDENGALSHSFFTGSTYECDICHAQVDTLTALKRHRSTHQHHHNNINNNNDMRHQ